MKDRFEYAYIGIDAEGRRYNAAYPPDREKYGDEFGGYPDLARKVLFQDFAVDGFDARFKLKGQRYQILSEPDHAARCDLRFLTEYEVFASPNRLIENMDIEGRRLMDIIDELEDVCTNEDMCVGFYRSELQQLAKTESEKMKGYHFHYVEKDDSGEYYNGKYPPDAEKYGCLFNGYRNESAQVLFEEFAVHGMNVRFEYHGTMYHLLFGWDYASLTDGNYCKSYEIFPDPNTLIENLRIDGKRLIDIVDDIDYAESV